LKANCEPIWRTFFFYQRLNWKSAKIRELIKDEIRRNSAGFEEIEEQGLDQKMKISHAGLHWCFFICFCLSVQKTKRHHPSLRHNSCFALIFKQRRRRATLVLKQTAQPHHGNIINIALFIYILRTVPPRLQLQPFLLAFEFTRPCILRNLMCTTQLPLSRHVF